MALVPAAGPVAYPWLQAGAAAAGQYFRHEENRQRAGAFISDSMGYIHRKSRRYKKRREEMKRKRAKVGEPMGKAAAKTHINNTALTSRNTRTQYIQEMTGMPQITTASSISSRSRQIINSIGFKLCIEFENMETVPLYINWAVISTKHGNTTPGVINFFRSQDSGTSRATTFNNTLTSNEFRCLPINTDIYNVLMHKRFIVAGTSTNTGYSHRVLDKYIKINRQLRYPTTGDIECETPIYIVYWADKPLQGTGTVPVASAYQVQFKIIHYFKEP